MVMRKPIFVRLLSDEERKTLKAGLRSPDAFVLRRWQILLASADGKNAYRIARTFGCHDQTVRNVIVEFNQKGLKETLRKGSRRPHTIPMRLSMRSGPGSSRRCSTRVREASTGTEVCGLRR